jgi:hypothetical protein
MIVDPVMKRASSLTSQAIGCATSTSASPNRPSGTRDTTRAYASGSRLRIRSTPSDVASGRTWITRMPSAPHSFAAYRVSVWIALLLAP